MDILAARKKAAERAREQKTKEQQAAAPVAEQQPPLLPEPARQPEPRRPEELSAAPGTLPGPADPAGPEQEQAGVPPVDAAGPQVQEIEMLSFRLGDEEYAVLVDDVKEVLKNRELTSVPNAPEYVLGVTSLRGPILPVIDLCMRLGFSAGVRDEKSRILVLSLHDEDTGIVVDRVTGVVRIHPDAIRPVPDTIERGAEFLKGIARKNDRLYILLDVEKALGGV